MEKAIIYIHGKNGSADEALKNRWWKPEHKPQFLAFLRKSINMIFNHKLLTHCITFMI